MDKISILIENEAQTLELAEKLAQHAFPGALFLLEGELGAGKTTFTKGIAKGLGISRMIKSPTYTLIREYQDGRLPLYHMDMYRLEEAGSDDLGLEEYILGQGLTVIEWAKFIADQLPSDFLLIQFHKLSEDEKVGENHLEARRIELVPSGLDYQKWLDKIQSQIQVIGQKEDDRDE